MSKIFEGRKGSYKIISKSKHEILVQYTSGPWLGQKVIMNLATHNRIQENIGLELTGKSLNQKLDQWWELYPNLYKKHWEAGVSSTKLLQTLETLYPEESKSIIVLLGD